MASNKGAAFNPEGLLDPAAYPWPAPTIDFIETHISWLFFTESYVLKVKRPVQFPFVDHRSFEARKRSCEEEVRLNRRLTSGVYLDVVPIVRKDTGYAVGGEGDVVEWGTLMRRMPAERMLNQLIASDQTPPDIGSRIGQVLRRFHDHAPVCATDPEHAREQLAVVLDNLTEAQDAAGGRLGHTLLSVVSDVVRMFLARNEGSVRGRIIEGFVRDGHGDLRADHICIEDDSTIQIFDCIEFNPVLRCADIASDLAFLLMDLKRLDRSDLAQDVLAGYGGGPDMVPPALLGLYETHRALVRVKTESLTINSIDGPIESLVLNAIRYLETAFRSAIRTQPCLLVMTGLSGTGKSTVAREIARTLGAVWLRTDEIREEIAASAGLESGWKQGAFAPEWTDRTYRELFSRAGATLADGCPAVLDGAFLDQDLRTRARDVAMSAGVPSLLIETIAPAAVVRERIETRAREGEDPSRATFEIYLRQREAVASQRLVTPEGMTGLVVDTTAEPGTMLESVWEAIARLGLFTSALEGEARFS